MKIDLPKKDRFTNKKKIDNNKKSDENNYAYGFDQIISSSPNSVFFMNSLKKRLNEY
jgi:hypothetical protein